VRRFLKAREHANAVASAAELTLRDLILRHLRELIPQLVDGETE
jgi:hypothetical protein